MGISEANTRNCKPILGVSGVGRKYHNNLGANKSLYHCYCFRYAGTMVRLILEVQTMRKKCVAPKKIDIQEFDCTKPPRLPDGDESKVMSGERR